MAMLYEHLVTGVLKRCHPKFFAVSSASSKWLQTFGIHNATVLPNSVNESELPTRQPGNPGKADRFSAGRLLPEKGIRQLVEGVSLLTQKGRAIELRVAGDGPLADEMRRRAASDPSLTYVGRISPSEVQEELSRADAFVHPSHLPEGLPTMLLEAGNAGVPVISTTHGGSGELIKEGHTGWALERGDAADIATQLDNLFSQQTEATRRSTKLFELIQERYTWPATVQRFLRALE